MQVREKAEQSLTEPVTAAEMIVYLDIDSFSEDETTLIGTMITTARKWLEDYTGLSVLSKSYEVRFYTEDKVGDYYELPFSPVTAITSVEISGTSVEYDERGLDRIYIRPQSTIITNTTTDEAYLDCEFIAGASSTTGSLAIKRIVSDMWNNRKDNLPDSPAAGLSWDTMKYIELLSNNTEL